MRGAARDRLHLSRARPATSLLLVAHLSVPLLTHIDLRRATGHWMQQLRGGHRLLLPLSALWSEWRGWRRVLRTVRVVQALSWLWVHDGLAGGIHPRMDVRRRLGRVRERVLARSALRIGRWRVRQVGRWLRLRQVVRRRLLEAVGGIEHRVRRVCLAWVLRTVVAKVLGRCRRVCRTKARRIAKRALLRRRWREILLGHKCLRIGRARAVGVLSATIGSLRVREAHLPRAPNLLAVHGHR